MSDAALYDLRERISALALRHRLPTIAYVPEFTDVGALMSYGPPRRAMYRRSADYVKRYWPATKPADLPVEQPTQIELSINLQTAKALWHRDSRRTTGARRSGGRLKVNAIPTPSKASALNALGSAQARSIAKCPCPYWHKQTSCCVA